jgi:hypothetical protein
MNEQHPNGQHEPLSFLILCASLRDDSLNKRLAKLAAQIVAKQGAIADIADFNQFDSVLYNHDLESQGTFPDGAKEFRNRLLANDAFIISSLSTMRPYRALSKMLLTGFQSFVRNHSMNAMPCYCLLRRQCLAATADCGH